MLKPDNVYFVKLYYALALRRIMGGVCQLPRYAIMISNIMKEDQRLYRERIVTDPRILAGKPVIKGTRIAVDLVLEELSHNPDIGELLAAHPDLTRTDVQACLAYAQALVTGEEISPKPLKGGRADAAL